MLGSARRRRFSWREGRPVTAGGLIASLRVVGFVMAFSYHNM